MFCFAGYTKKPTNLAERVVFGSWWLFCIIVVATYGANLVAFLAVTQRTLPFTTLEELSAQSDYKYGFMGGTGWVTLFKVD